jgi:hypothetical protein
MPISPNCIALIYLASQSVNTTSTICDGLPTTPVNATLMIISLYHLAETPYLALDAG